MWRTRSFTLHNQAVFAAAFFGSDLGRVLTGTNTPLDKRLYNAVILPSLIFSRSFREIKIS
jgi:hypothetical protein